MITPGFASDCVETLEEVAIGLKETFEEAGGEKFSVVPCLNDSRALDHHDGKHRPQRAQGLDLRRLEVAATAQHGAAEPAFGGATE